jgi:hypothetical protein
MTLIHLNHSAEMTNRKKHVKKFKYAEHNNSDIDSYVTTYIYIYVCVCVCV